MKVSGSEVSGFSGVEVSGWRALRFVSHQREGFGLRGGLRCFEGLGGLRFFRFDTNQLNAKGPTLHA